MDPVRRRMLTLLAEPTSGATLARKAGIKRQLVNYHLREMEEAGLVRTVEEKKRGNCTERVVQATAATYLISPEILGPLATDPANIGDTMSWAYLVALAARQIRELAILRERADATGKNLHTFSLHADIRFASQGNLNKFSEELAKAFAQLTAKYGAAADADARLFRVSVGMHPAVTKTEEQARAEAAQAQKTADHGQARSGLPVPPDQPKGA